MGELSNPIALTSCLYIVLLIMVYVNDSIYTVTLRIISRCCMDEK